MPQMAISGLPNSIHKLGMSCRSRGKGCLGSVRDSKQWAIRVKTIGQSLASLAKNINQDTMCKKAAKYLRDP